MFSLEKKLDLVQTSFETQHRARRDLSEEKAAHHVEKRQSRGQKVRCSVIWVCSCEMLIWSS